MNYFKALVSFGKTRLRKFYYPSVHASLNVEIEIRQNFYSTFLSKNDLAFDIGANLGNRIQPLLNIGARVVAVEPQSFCVEYLKLLYGTKINILRIALGAKQYQSVIHLNKQASTISSMSVEWIKSVKQARFKDFDWHKTENVEVDTLDNVIEKCGIPVFIKIDVEGFEVEVLKGLSQPIPIISFEYTTPECAKNLVECLDLLSALDNDYQFNYSSGESNRFNLDEWLSAVDFKKLIHQDENFLEGFGDVYAKQLTKVVQMKR